jgi:ribosomal-protein-alanine N-acetyltransferase
MSTHTPQPSRPLPPLTDALASERDSVRFEPLNVLWLDTLLPVEQQA